MKTKYNSTLSAADAKGVDQKLNNTVPGRSFALGLFGILLISVCALLPSPAQAQCKRWDVSGQWEMRTSNGGISSLNLRQGKWEGASANLTGTTAGHAISGNISGNAFTMAYTVDGLPRRYTGTIGASGIIEGYIGARDASGVYWVSSRSMKCADANPQKTGASSMSESSSNDTQDWHKKHKKNKKKHHHHDDDQEQGND